MRSIDIDAIKPETNCSEIPNKSDTIYRQAAIDIASGHCHPANIADELSKLPPAQPKPKTGHWIYLKHNKAKCSECDDVVLILQMYGNANYCPNCGAKMEEEDGKTG